MRSKANLQVQTELLLKECLNRVRNQVVQQRRQSMLNLLRHELLA